MHSGASGVTCLERVCGRAAPKRSLYDRAAAPIQDYPVPLTIILDSNGGTETRVSRLVMT
jgi:hypothetical protein